VIECRSGFRFLFESSEAVLILRELGRQDLDRDLSVEAAIERPIHDAHAPAAQGLEQLEALIEPDGAARRFRAAPTPITDQSQTVVARFEVDYGVRALGLGEVASAQREDGVVGQTPP
jgi:hypothetical protein